jgi:hypothetical protein
MLAARSWVESPTTLNVVTALGTMLAGIGAIWVLLIAGPRYRLRYGPVTSRQLPDGSWKVGIHLSSRGRRDITRDAFDEGKPILLDIGTSIRGLEGVWSSHESVRMVNARALGTCLLVGPGLIGRRQDLRFTVLVGAKPTGLRCQASLIDVSVRRQFLTPYRRFLASVFVGFAVTTGAVALTIAIVFSAGVQLQPAITFGIGIIFGIGLAVWAIVRSRYPHD